jgi:hypothetical protein
VENTAMWLLSITEAEHIFIDTLIFTISLLKSAPKRFTVSQPIGHMNKMATAPTKVYQVDEIKTDEQQDAALLWLPCLSEAEHINIHTWI